jgi:hypothetical protein
MHFLLSAEVFNAFPIFAPAGESPEKHERPPTGKAFLLR